MIDNEVAYDKDFESILKGSYTLLVTQTVVNFPDVMMPYMIHNRWSIIYFVVFLLINFVLLSNMLIGIFYLNYKVELARTASKITDHDEIYDLILDFIGNDQVSSQEIITAVEDYFMQIQRENIENTEEGPKEEKIPKNADPARQYIDTEKFNFIMGILSGLCFFIIVIGEEEIGKGNEIVFSVIFFFNTILLLENFARIYFLGFSYCVKKFLFVIDFIGDLASEILLLAFILSSNDKKISYWFSIFMLLKFAKFYEALLLYKPLRFTYVSFLKLGPFTFELLSVMLSLFWIFNEIGMYIFGGALNSTVDLSKHQLPQDYIVNNFNDRLNGMVTLFELMIVNNWNVQVDVHCAVMGSNIYRLFFVFFYIISVLFCLNILVGFIIDYLTSQWKDNYSINFERKASKEVINKLMSRRMSREYKSNTKSFTPRHRFSKEGGSGSNESKKSICISHRRKSEAYSFTETYDQTVYNGKKST